MSTLKQDDQARTANCEELPTPWRLTALTDWGDGTHRQRSYFFFAPERCKTLAATDLALALEFGFASTRPAALGDLGTACFLAIVNLRPSRLPPFRSPRCPTPEGWGST